MGGVFKVGESQKGWIQTKISIQDEKSVLHRETERVRVIENTQKIERKRERERGGLKLVALQ